MEKLSYIFFIALVSISCNNSSKPENKNSEAALPVSPPAAVTNENIARTVDMPVVSMDSIQALLKGKWMRSDGSYTIEIFSASRDGRMDAGYFNPNPINVGKSGWEMKEGVIFLDIVLRDVNYPGSRYNLIYDKKTNCLAGNYFQAVEGINYDVVFQRKK